MNRPRKIIQVVARAAQQGRVAVPYDEVAAALGVPAQGLGPYLAEATRLCRAQGLPDVAPSVVSKASLASLASLPMPSDAVFDRTGYWKSSGITREQVAQCQRRVLDHDWSRHPALFL